MTMDILDWTTPEVSQEDRDSIRSHAIMRNEDRACSGLPPYDVDEQVRIEVADLRDAMYKDRLRPYVERYYSEIDGSPGIAGRIVQHIEVYKRAEEALRQEHGTVRPRPVAFDLLIFLQRYSEGALKEWGGCFSPAERVE